MWRGPRLLWHTDAHDAQGCTSRHRDRGDDDGFHVARCVERVRRRRLALPAGRWPTTRAATASRRPSHARRAARSVETRRCRPTRRSTASTSTRRSASSRARTPTRTVDPQQRAIAQYQASRFSQTLPRVRADVPPADARSALAAGGSAEALQLAYGDVEEAWRDYLANHNDGRGVVLIGHSQGTRMLRQLVRKEIDRSAGRAPAARVGAPARRQRDRAQGARTSAATSRTSPRARARARSAASIAWSTFNETPPRLPLRPRAGRGHERPRLPGRAGLRGPLHQPGVARRERARAALDLPAQRAVPGRHRRAARCRCTAGPRRPRPRRGSSRRTTTPVAASARRRERPDDRARSAARAR